MLDALVTENTQNFHDSNLYDIGLFKCIDNKNRKAVDVLAFHHWYFAARQAKTAQTAG